MDRLRFSVRIRSPRQLVWATMLGRETFTAWTETFAEGCYFEGSWDRGARIRFLAPGGDGMSSFIAENRPLEFISIRHVGIIKNGVEVRRSLESRYWTPAFENCTFTERGGTTEVEVEMGVAPRYAAHMTDAWPQALARLKEICEAK